MKINGLVSRYKATEREYPGLLVKADADTPLCDLEYSDGRVYIVNAEQLKACLTDYDDAIVYIWGPYCSAEECYSPSLLQKYCAQKNVELFVVTEYYAGEELVQYYDLKRPLFGIDTKHYKTDFCDKYVDRFKNDLAVDDNRMGRMLYFKKGKYVGAAKLEFER